MKKAVEELRKLDCLKVNVQVRKSNPSAIGFHKHLGFKDDNVVSLGLRLKSRARERVLDKKACKTLH